MDTALHASEQILAAVGDGDLDALLSGEDPQVEDTIEMPAEDAEELAAALEHGAEDTDTDDEVESPEAEADDAEADEEEYDEESEYDDDTSYDMPEDLAVQQTDDGHVFGMEIDGEFHSLDDLRRGNLRTADYTRKTQEVAAIRKEAAAAREEFLQQTGQYASLLETVEANVGDAVDAVLGNRSEADWAALLEASPEQYKAEQKALANAKGELAEIRKHREAVEAERQQSLAEAVAARQQECQAQLLDAIPEWNNADTLQRDATDLTDLLDSEYGFTEAERAVTTDARVWRLAYDALRYRRLVGKKDGAVKKTVKKKTPTLRAGKSETKSERVARKSRKVTAARKRLKQTGALDDAQAAAFELLEQFGEP
jgi:hypothetical protein